MSIIYEIQYKPSFVRKFKKANPLLQEEILETIELLKDSKNHDKLRVHKLKGQLKDFHSCSVNYKHRIVIQFQKGTIIILLEVGDHSIYQ